VAPDALDVSLTRRSLMTNRESVSKPLTLTQAMDGRDAFVKVVQVLNILGKKQIKMGQAKNVKILSGKFNDRKQIRLMAPNSS